MFANWFSAHRPVPPSHGAQSCRGERPHLPLRTMGECAVCHIAWHAMATLHQIDRTADPSCCRHGLIPTALDLALVPAEQSLLETPCLLRAGAPDSVASRLRLQIPGKALTGGSRWHGDPTSEWEGGGETRGNCPRGVRKAALYDVCELVRRKPHVLSGDAAGRREWLTTRR